MIVIDSSTPNMFSENAFIAEVIQEYFNRCENQIYDDIYNIIEELLQKYSDFQEYKRINYSHINNVEAHLYYKISDLLDNEYNSGADTDGDND